MDRVDLHGHRVCGRYQIGRGSEYCRSFSGRSLLTVKYSLTCVGDRFAGRMVAETGHRLQLDQGSWKGRDVSFLS